MSEVRRSTEPRTTRRGTLLTPKPPKIEGLEEAGVEARKIFAELEEGIRRTRPILEAIGAEFARSLAELERAYGQRPR